MASIHLPMTAPEYIEIFASAYPQDLQPIADFLQTHDIHCVIEAAGTDFNPNLAFSRMPDAVRLMVLFYDYDRAKALLVAHEFLANQDDEAGMREMLGGMDDDELLEIVADAQRQPADQVAVARKLLLERGVSLEPEKIDDKVQAITEVERKPRVIPIWGKLMFILLCVAIPVAGVGASVIIAFFRGRDARGDGYWLFSTVDRALFMVVGGLALLLWLGFSLWSARVSITLYDNWFYY
jgi:hypothetical protein